MLLQNMDRRELKYLDRFALVGDYHNAYIAEWHDLICEYIDHDDFSRENKNKSDDEIDAMIQSLTKIDPFGDYQQFKSLSETVEQFYAELDEAIESGDDLREFVSKSLVFRVNINGRSVDLLREACKYCDCLNECVETLDYIDECCY